ncbi:transposase [Candidatus Vondammii sp. HM_W22]|uniref:transposase n=1 Tax=Candidatus Vondammii sp. HM_W22 TaxID=2687299 RepID=UPI00403E227B
MCPALFSSWKALKTHPPNGGPSILKHLEDLSDEVLIQRWIQNPYYPSFTGEIEFQWQLPCDPSDLTYFRKRIGNEGFEKVLAASIALQRWIP